MAVSWTPHRFSGGILALDVANTVVLRQDPALRFDRFDDPREIVRFAEAATALRAVELKGSALAVGDPEAIHACVVCVRETTDRLFRGFVETGELDTTALADFLRACATGLDGWHGTISRDASRVGDGAATIPFQAALSVSALSLLPLSELRRLRVCQNCHWLFLDRSRNGSRVWCDMAVCGNREKARRHRDRIRTREMPDA